MNVYITAIKAAILFFPFMALLFTLPYMLLQYRRFGAILFLRTVVVYSFSLYMLCVYCLVVLPLPDIESVQAMTSATIQLTPFRQLAETLQEAPIIWGDSSTYFDFIYTKTFFQIAANIVMTIPFGIYLRYYFKCSFFKTMLLSFLLSVSFELIQLSALFGIYPRPYRVADVDDLINNTLGGVLGYAIAPLFMKILPSKERMDIVSYKRGTQVSVTRRIFAATIDWIAIAIMVALAVVVLPRNELMKTFLMVPEKDGTKQILLWFFCVYAIVVTVYYMFGTWVFKGRSIGKWILHLRVVDRRNNQRPKLWQCMIRYGILYIIVLPAPVLGLTAITLVKGKGLMMVAAILVCLMLAVIYIVFWLLLTVHVFTHSNQLLHGKLSMTRNISTLPAKQLIKKRMNQNTVQSE